MKKKKAKQKQLTKFQFVKTILAEIKDVAKTKPYHAFLLLGSFNEFARLELGINVFKSQVVNKGLEYMTNHYKPLGLWLTSKETARIKHNKVYKGRLVLEINKTIKEAESVISKAKIDNKPFLNI